MANEGLTLRVTKIDAAHRQLQTAIRMWFYDQDAVSVHTLAFAAYEIAHFVSKSRKPNRPDLLLDSGYVKPDKRREFNQAFREAANFFKHADRDPEASIEFAPGISDIFLYFAVVGLHEAGVNLATEIRAFVFWMQVTYPEIMLSQDVQEMVAESGLIGNLVAFQTLSKSVFFDAFIDGHDKSNSVS
jgi:hypothetical protein